MNSTRSTIERLFREALEGACQKSPESFSDDLVLLKSGLDSLGFAILVTRLEQDLGYDPFTLTEEAVYPTTFGELIEIYQRFAPRP